MGHAVTKVTIRRSSYMYLYRPKYTTKRQYVLTFKVYDANVYLNLHHMCFSIKASAIIAYDM